eukprot:Awhi_evm1s5551
MESSMVCLLNFPVLLLLFLFGGSEATFCNKEFTLKTAEFPNFLKVIAIEEHLDKNDPTHMGKQLGPYPINQLNGKNGRSNSVEEYHPTFPESRFSIANGTGLTCDVLRCEMHNTDGDGAKGKMNKIQRTEWFTSVKSADWALGFPGETMIFQFRMRLSKGVYIPLKWPENGYFHLFQNYPDQTLKQSKSYPRNDTSVVQYPPNPEEAKTGPSMNLSIKPENNGKPAQLYVKIPGNKAGTTRQKDYKLADLQDIEGKWVEIYMKFRFSTETDGGYHIAVHDDSGKDDLANTVRFKTGLYRKFGTLADLDTYNTTHNKVDSIEYSQFTIYKCFHGQGIDCDGPSTTLDRSRKSSSSRSRRGVSMSLVPQGTTTCKAWAGTESVDNQCKESNPFHYAVNDGMDESDLECLNNVDCIDKCCKIDYDCESWAEDQTINGRCQEYGDQYYGLPKVDKMSCGDDLDCRRTCCRNHAINTTETKNIPRRKKVLNTKTLLKRNIRKLKKTGGMNYDLGKGIYSTRHITVP